MRTIEIRNIRWALYFAFTLLGVSSIYGFSPYENFILSGQPRHIGLIATASIEQINTIQQQFESISKEEVKKLNKKGIRNLCVFGRVIKNKGFVFTYFTYDRSDYLNAEKLLLEHSETFSALTQNVDAHPRAPQKSSWLNMEWMNCIGTTAVFPHQSKNVRQMALVSGLHPEKEVSYRQLHQTNWPGNTECMVECNYRNWTTFLVEFGDELMLFSYTEYIGPNLDADNKKMAANPITQRWWKYSNDCLINLIGEGDWTLMEAILKPLQ